MPQMCALVAGARNIGKQLHEAGGWLPNIERYFNARGTHVRNAATCVPSIT